ncbi:hypothetical protein GCM10023063_03620 [Arthrobacter methylotrophus]
MLGMKGVPGFPAEAGNPQEGHCLAAVAGHRAAEAEELHLGYSWHHFRPEV